MESKKPWQSKTILLNAIASILAGVTMLLPKAGDLSVWIDSHVAEIGIGWGVANMLLRLVTKGKISLEE